MNLQINFPQISKSAIHSIILLYTLTCCTVHGENSISLQMFSRGNNIEFYSTGIRFSSYIILFLI